MMRSMYAGVSGLRNHQIRMDVIGNNIANVNTIAFKSSRVTFQEVFNQTIRGASSPSGDRGGTNPQQVGLGMALASIDTFHTQGNLQPTGNNTDLAIQGNGFFILSEGGSHLFTRAGNFSTDSSGYLVNPDGLRVQGWMAQDGQFPALDVDNLTDIRIPLGTTIPPKATTRITFGYNLDARTSIGNSYTTEVKVYDSLGEPHSVTITFTRSSVNPNQWTWQASGSVVTAGDGTITFDSSGLYQSDAVNNPITLNPPGASAMNVTLDLQGLTQYVGDSTASVVDRDGYAMGSLTKFTIDTSGVVTGVFSNGLTSPLARLALASFQNPGGLTKLGQNLYEESNNSGLKQVGPAGTADRGTIAPGSLEMSNVDLSREFTEMIITQRGFQANSRIITTSDQMLEELVNLKR